MMISSRAEIKRFLPALLLLVSTTVLGANLPGDGIYLRARGKPALWVKSQDGQKLFLGARQDLKFTKAELYAQNNANDSFHLQLTIPYEKRLVFILVVSGIAFEQIELGSWETETSWLGFHISGDQNAKRVSEYLKTPIVYYRHPQHNLRVTFNPAQKEFNIGEEVTATLQIENVGTNSISFRKGGMNRATRENQYVFSARHRSKQVDDIGTSDHWGGFGTIRVVKPGELFEDRISLSKWFAFDKAGVYHVHGSYLLAFIDPEAESRRINWLDYASADCTIRMKKLEEPSNKSAELTRRP